MTKLIVSALVSLDGVMEKPWEWVGDFFNEEVQQDCIAKLSEVDLFLLGRKTYQQFSSTWPNSKGNKYMDNMNSLKKIVASNTLKKATWNASIINGDIAAEIAKLKKEKGKDILEYGLGQLFRTLLENRLIDEFHFYIMPVALGKGKQIFERVNVKGFKLKLTKTKTFSNGVVLLIYIPEYV